MLDCLSLQTCSIFLPLSLEPVGVPSRQCPYALSFLGTERKRRPYSRHRTKCRRDTEAQKQHWCPITLPALLAFAVPAPPWGWFSLLGHRTNQPGFRTPPPLPTSHCPAHCDGRPQGIERSSQARGPLARPAGARVPPAPASSDLLCCKCPTQEGGTWGGVVPLAGPVTTLRG